MISMKRTLTLIIVILAILELVFIFFISAKCNTVINVNKELTLEKLELLEIAKYEDVYYTYLSSANGDNNVSYDFFLYPESPEYYKEKFTWWDEIYSNETAKKFAKGIGVSIPDMDFSKETMIASFGRKIVNIKKYSTDYFNKYWNETDLTPESIAYVYVAVVTFSEEYYKDMIFFYDVIRSVEKDQGNAFVISKIMSPYYIMNGNRAEFIDNCLWYNKNKW